MLAGVATLWPAAASAQSADSSSSRASERPPALRTSSSIDTELAGGAKPEQPADPARILAFVGAGSALRLVKNVQFQQERFAPAFLDLAGTFVLPGRGLWRHGVGLGASLNLTGDGTYSLGLDPATQLVVEPSYTAYLRFGDTAVPDIVAWGKVGVPLALTPDFAPGVEIAGGGAYMLLAGLGIYAEVGLSTFIGGDSRGGSTTYHPLLSAELGVMIDYEVLP